MDAAHVADERLDDLVDGLLAPETAAAVVAHVDRCRACRARLAELRAFLAVSRASGADARTPAELWPRVAALTIHGRAVRRHVVRSLRAPMVAIALAIAALAAAAGAYAAIRVTDRQARAAAPAAAPDDGIAPAR